jgi:4-hydroxybenzoate polyprenyltransferase
MLRVFDEHKDYELDCHNHPERVLQSGVITLGHLKVLGVLAIVVQGGVSFYLADGWGKIPMFWLIAFVWSLLMAAEFFCGEWLEKRLVLYAFSHMVVMPMALIWMVQMGAGETQLSIDVALLAGLSFLSGAAFEVTRKMKAPEDERDTIDSYTKVFGTGRAPFVVLGLLDAGVVLLAVLLHAVFPEGVALWWYALLFATLLPASFALIAFRKAPSAKAANKCEGMVALAMLAGYVILLAAIWVERGVRWV